MHIRWIQICISFLILTLLGGCIKEDLSKCRNKAWFELRVVWPDPTHKPEGTRIAIYPIGINAYNVDNLSPDGGKILISKGNYSFLIHNNDNAKTRLRNVKNYQTYEAFTKVIYPSAYKRPVKDEEILEQPDMLWVADVKEKVIAESEVMVVYPLPIVYKYTFILKNVKGQENIRAVRGSVTSMMGTHFLNNAVPVLKPHTIFFENATIGNGIMFDILAFGVIEYVVEEGSMKSRNHILTVEFMNKSEVRRYNIEVTKKLNLIPFGGVIIIYDEIEVPPGEDIGGGFNPDVGDWDNVIVPLG